MAYLLRTNWGGSGGTHPPIILTPPNSRSDLILTSEVFVQPFLSLQQHEYHYKAENGSAHNNVFCQMRVEWQALQVTWSYLSPGPSDVSRQSFFSPQLVRTSVQADVLGGVGNPCQSRPVRGEAADACVTWTDKVWRGIWDLVKDVIKEKGKTISLVAAIAWSAGAILQIEPSVRLLNPKFLYELRVSNSKDNTIRSRIGTASFPDQQKLTELEPGGSKSLAFESQEPPGETTAMFEYQVPGWENFGFTRFPVTLIVPQPNS